MPGDADRPYDAVYAGFDSPLMRRVRAEASAEDLGQHSWVTAEQLRADIGRLRLTRAVRLLDLGCGACGPLTFVLRAVGCRGTGLERSAEAVTLGRERAATLGLAGWQRSREETWITACRWRASRSAPRCLWT